VVIDASPSKIDATRHGHAVSIDHIPHAFGDHVVLDDVTLDIAPGELVALLALWRPSITCRSRSAGCLDLHRHCRFHLLS
jgi:hypothetical protein